MGIDTDSSFGRMLAENIIQAQKAAAQLDVLNGQIDSLQSSYTNLTDIVDTYNRYGYITLTSSRIFLQWSRNILHVL